MQTRQMGNEKLRLRLISDGVIENRIFLKDYLFSSTSAAASVILGSSSSGMEQWKDKEGTAIGAYIEKETVCPPS